MLDRDQRADIGGPHTAILANRIWGAYDVSTADPDLLASPEENPGLLEAAGLLQDAYLSVHGSPTSPDFRLDVGFGSVSGRLDVKTQAVGSRCLLSIGFAGEPTDLAPVRQILDALEYPELLSVYYRSGHSLVDGQIWTAQLPRVGFRNWMFEDFDPCLITQEKPIGKTPQEIHGNIGESGDRSLFGWVSRHLSSRAEPVAPSPP